jgi:hypothetical protein
MKQTCAALGTACVLAALPVRANAQTASVRDVLSVLMTNQDVPTADFVRDRQAAEATRDTVARALLVELATLPITTSSGGFSYRLNPSLGTVERVTRSFGPFFVDRATTAGRNQASVSVSYQYSNFANLDGRDLRNGSLQTTANKFRDEAAPFDVAALKLKLQTSTVTGFANYGLTDALDIGVAVPVVYLSMSGELVDTYRGTSKVQARGKANSFGIADVAIRSKLRLFRAGAGGGVAAAFEARLPTGSPENLRGAGKSGFKTSLIGSAGAGRIETHVNGSMTVGGVSREESVAAALVVASTSRLTLSGEAIFRRVDQLAGIQPVARPHPSIVGVDTIRLLPSAPGITTGTVVGGMRLNITSTLLLNAHVVVPVTTRGLTARAPPVVSMDYSFVH